MPLPAADACPLARLYRERCTLEKAVLDLTGQRRCEINTLAYPAAARFGLAMAVVAYPVLALVKATLRPVFRAEAIDEGVSGSSMGHEMATVAQRLETRVEPEDGVVFQTLTLAAMATWLIETAGRLQVRKSRKHPRGPHKAPLKREHDPQRPHVSVARVLPQHKKAKKTKAGTGP